MKDRLVAWFRWWHSKKHSHFIHWLLFLIVSGVLVVTVRENITSSAFIEEIPSSQQLNPPTRSQAGHVLIKLRYGVTRTSVEFNALLKEVDGDISKKYLELSKIGIFVIDIPLEADPNAVVAKFRDSGLVESAQVDKILRNNLTPNDPSYSSQWHLSKINAPAAWDNSTCQNQVTIAVLDTGVSSAHPDLASSLVAGHNTAFNNSAIEDVHGHGTATAGSAAAVTNNGTGVAGVGWGCKIMPIKVTGDSSPNTTSGDLLLGLMWAADNGAKVANISYIVTGDPMVEYGASYFMGKGGVVTISSGNGGSTLSTPDSPYILTVGSTGSSDSLSSFSNRGPMVDLVAPGEGIYTTNMPNNYNSWSGTSFSAPVAAGAVALVMSVNPNLTPSQVQQVMKDSAHDLGTAGWDSSYGWGRLDVGAAVTLAKSMLGSPPPPDTQDPSVSISVPTNGATANSTFNAIVVASDNVGVTQVTIKIDGQTFGSTTGSTYSFPLNTTSYSDGSHALVATASDAAGNVGTSSTVTFTIDNSSGTSYDLTPPSNTSLNLDTPDNPATPTTPGKTSTKDTQAPTVTISTPVNNSVLPYANNSTITVSASDNGKIKSISVYVNDALVKYCKSATTCNFDWESAQLAIGKYTVTAKADDTYGNKSQTVSATSFKKAKRR